MTNRIGKRLLFTLAAVTIVMVLLMVSTPLRLVKTADKHSTYRIPSSLSAKVTKEAIGMDTEQIIEYSLSLTASELRFAVMNDIPEGKANCVGYAQLCAVICNQAMAINGIDGEAKPVVGYIEAGGINWCKVLKAIAPKTNYKNFVKDHDFVELTVESKRFYFDPSIYDVLGKKCLSMSNKTINNS